MTTDAAGPDDKDWSTLGAFLCGLATGAVLTVLFAPARGQETRARLVAKAREAGDRLSKHAYIGRLEGELEAWTATLEGLTARVSQASGEFRGEYERRIADLRTRLDTARHTLERLRTAGEAAWQELQAGADRAWGELRTGVNRAVSELHDNGPGHAG
jgi:gas vesicle protein